MPAKEPFHPKANTPSIERNKKNGMFQNPPSYPQLGGFSSSQRLPRTGTQPSPEACCRGAVSQSSGEVG